MFGLMSRSVQGQMKLMVRSIMVAVLQMIVLKELLGSMRPICLLLNPVSWFELERPNDSWPKGWAFKPLCPRASRFCVYFQACALTSFEHGWFPGLPFQILCGHCSAMSQKSSKHSSFQTLLLQILYE